MPEPEPDPEPRLAEPAPESEQSWSPATRIAFRFVVCYFALHLATSSHLTLILPFRDALLRGYSTFWLVIVTWVGKDILHLPHDIYLYGEVDGISNSAFGTVLFLCYLATAAVGAAVWTVLDRRRGRRGHRGRYDRLHAWFRYLLRSSLALTIIHYGAIKLIPAQMISPPPFGMLMLRVGDLTPMQLLWTFTGASPTYESLVGGAELMGGLLLLWRRTTLLGALVCAANLTMVVVLNFCFDVQVKLYSMHLLASALLLIAPDLRRLADVVLFNRRAEPRTEFPLFARRRLDWLAQILLVAMGLYATGSGLLTAWDRHQSIHPPEPPLHGIWWVMEPEPPGPEPDPWRRLTFARVGTVTVESTDGTYEGFHADVNPRRRTLRLAKDRRWRASFTWTEPEPGTLILTGSRDGKPVRLTLERMALMQKGFTWFFDPNKAEAEAERRAMRPAR